jgi:hypothetical protein
MTDLLKTASKFDLQKLIGDVKSMLSPVVIPEANKDNPIGYCLSELSKLAKDLAENHAKQADAIAKITTILGTLGGLATQLPASEAKLASETKEAK